jgi:hypothetical protein
MMMGDIWKEGPVYEPKEGEMVEWHIEDVRAGGQSLCGVDARSEWSFTGIDHAFYALRNEDRLVPCKACAAVVAKAFGELPA